MSTFSEKIEFGKRQFFIKAIFHSIYLLFLENCLYRAATFSRPTFSEELLFYNILFENGYYFTATVPFHSYTTYSLVIK